MTLEEFEVTLAGARPPAGAGALLQALWYEAKGEWEPAHRIAQDDDGADGAWVHAYLHRVEGDLGNAGYWYLRAGRPRAEGPLREEWRAIVSELLSRVT
jgi:hypothetical protein